MNYRSQAEMNEGCRGLASEVCGRFDLIVGVPRSGMPVATLLALYLDLPVSDVEGLAEQRIMGSGYRYDGSLDFDGIERILVVDDSVNSGRQIRETKARIAQMNLDIDVEYAAIYVTPSGTQSVDYWWEVVEMPRLFEWNIFHHPRLKDACVDIDGVLCRDPYPEENDDGSAYRKFLRTVEPRYIPSKRIGWLVTCRLEQYRPETEAWLDKHGIEYDHLVMMDLPNKEARHEMDNRSEYKASVYERTGAQLFIESSTEQATDIAQLTRKPVYCVEQNDMVGRTANVATRTPTDSQSTGQRLGHYVGRFSRQPVGFSRMTANHLSSLARSKVTRFADELN